MELDHRHDCKSDNELVSVTHHWESLDVLQASLLCDISPIFDRGIPSTSSMRVVSPAMAMARGSSHISVFFSRIVDFIPISGSV